MTPLDEVARLLEILRPDYTDDYWADEVEARLAVALEALTHDEWVRLIESVAGEPPGVRARLGTALRHVPSERTTDLLVAFVRSSDSEVVAAATESLFEQYHFRLPGVSLRDELTRHLRTARPDVRARLAALLARAVD